MDGLDACFQALADAKRRLAVYYLQEHGQLALADLAELVIEEQRGRPVTAIADEQVKELYLSLYHTHLPVLENAGIARYDQERDLVAKTDETEPLLRDVQESVGSLRIE